MQFYSTFELDFAASKRYMHILFTFAISSLICVFQLNAQEFQLRNGDLLFKEIAGDSAFVDAVTTATRSIDRYQFSHVGVFCFHGKKPMVMEAVFSGVKATPLDSFLLSARHIENRPVVMVERLKPPYRQSIKGALKAIKKLVGKPYDLEFLPGNDSYYCSELVYETFRIDRKPVFTAKPMTFKNLNTGEMSPLWIKYFKELGKPIPEGVIGTNPGEMSRADALTILGLIPEKYWK